MRSGPAARDHLGALSSEPARHETPPEQPQSARAMPPSPHVPEICGEVVAEGIRQLFEGTQRPDLVTFSFGAHVGVFAATALGGRLRSMTIIGCAALGLPHKRANFFKEEPGMSWRERDEVHRRNLEILMIAEPSRIDDLAIYIQARNIDSARFRSRAFAGGDEIRGGCW